MAKDPTVGETTNQNRGDILLPRRRPAQQRSRETFEKILTSARTVLVECGFESFTFDEVSKRATLPIGTIYRFFANKYVLICELDRQDTASAIAEMQRFAEQMPGIQWPMVLDELIDHLALMWRADPSRRAVWHAVQSTPATRATAAATELPLIELLGSVLKPLAPQRSDQERGDLARILVHTMTSLLNFAVTEDARFDVTVREIKRMILAYLFDAAQPS
ncbi:TetR/AcrR family transcriptional regulator [Corynebacterium gerontici]|uniref:Transcriptional regulator, TetR family n=1 Tax=Corynebacterium gerontici TaxID=2079234 RepID=A0A3G6J7H0_9CORY|nr:TetR/AcrR family transcriptional regulator [Corynebacterium gerontici]AZA11984.1 Transcriptional regulator, TetR family [Corynebacterium gerontici]